MWADALAETFEAPPESADLHVIEGRGLRAP